MKMLVAMGLTREQVQKFMNDFFECDSAAMTAISIIPERKKAVENNHGIPFCIILSAVNGTIADFLINHIFNEDANGYHGLMAHWGWGNIFKVMEENEVLALEFIEPSQIEGLHDEDEKPPFGWWGSKNT
ncbi:MAG: hypothetical protein WCT26_03535 [Candidatus Buchananbacteria bacterium]|jgi:hypothetical protein